MNRKEIKEKAEEAIESHFNCAESVFSSVCRGVGFGAEMPVRVASCFGGGVGRTFSELCGALSGGLMALGLVVGRDSPAASCERAYDLAAEFRQRFIARHGASICGEILDRFGDQKNWEGCKRLVSDTAGMLHEFLDADAHAGS
ncbi:C-GCAxxG-C-C family (seleno)protein [Desulfovibrio aminophilus]|uniref:C-GCAxxG-C-C family protein n=1 Tax=Desulfovibrio aminophilus TaxID=81425 RepID=UPI003396472A